MSVNPDMTANMGVAEEFVDLEHQLIRQKVDFTDATADVVELTPGDPGAEFDPGERQLDREEVAQLVAYRRFATVNYLTQPGGFVDGTDIFTIVDASVGINGDLFREVTTKSLVTTEPDGVELEVDEGGEIGLLDNYQIFASTAGDNDAGAGFGPINTISEHTIDFYNWPTGGPIVDSFDTITCGFAAGFSGKGTNAECQVELRYDFWWDVAEQGRSTNPFGRPSTR